MTSSSCKRRSHPSWKSITTTNCFPSRIPYQQKNPWRVFSGCPTKPSCHSTNIRTKCGFLISIWLRSFSSCRIIIFMKIFARMPAIHSILWIVLGLIPCFKIMRRSGIKLLGLGSLDRLMNILMICRSGGGIPFFWRFGDDCIWLASFFIFWKFNLRRKRFWRLFFMPIFVIGLCLSLVMKVGILVIRMRMCNTGGNFGWGRQIILKSMVLLAPVFTQLAIYGIMHQFTN